MKSLRWICLFVAVSWAGACFVQAQTIADAAREERERRKEVESSTTETIPVVSNASAATAATATSAAPKVKTTAPATEKSKPTGPTDLNGHDEKYWRPKFDAARLNIKRAEDHLKVVDLKVADLSSRMNRISYATPSIRAELDRTTRDQTAAQKALADAKQKFADLEDELRRAGGLPGWSRPQ